jgi:hypothetical protein
VGASNTGPIQERTFESHPPGDGRQWSESHVSIPLRTTPPSFAQSLTGPMHSVKMLRDRYKKWSINDKNCKPKNKPQRRVTAAPKGITTQTALQMSPRIVELEDDETHSALVPVGALNEANLLHRFNKRTESPRTALSSLDPRFHEIMNGLLDWCDAWVNFPFESGDPDESTDEDLFLFSSSANGLICAESEQAWRRFMDAFSVDMMLLGLRRTFHLSILIYTLCIVRQYRPQGGSARLRSRILQAFHQHTVRFLGPRHPVTLLFDWSAHGLPLTTLSDVSAGIAEIHILRESIIHRRKFGEQSLELLLHTNDHRSLFRMKLRLSKKKK